MEGLTPEEMKAFIAAVEVAKPRTFMGIAAHYMHLLIQYLFATVVTAIIVMVIHRAFQPLLLSTLDEVRDSTKEFRRILDKKSNITTDERSLAGKMVIAYAITAGAFFIGIMMLVSDLATPVG